MTKAQASTVASDLIAAGYNATATMLIDGVTWVVRASNAGGGSVGIAQIQTFATNHGVSAETVEATFR